MSQQETKPGDGRHHTEGFVGSAVLHIYFDLFCGALDGHVFTETLETVTATLLLEFLSAIDLNGQNLNQY